MNCKPAFIFWTILVIAFLNSGTTYSQVNPCQEITNYKIVVLGSSTAAGAGPSTSDSAWVNKYRSYLQAINPNNEVINLAVGGYNTYRIMPTGFLPPSNRPNPDVNKNISAALAEQPDAIIVNMPSNDVAAGFSYAEQMFNIDTIVQIANNNGIPIWICTTQPRNFSNTNSLQLQSDLKDSIISIYGNQSIDFWSVLANTNHSTNPLYDSGDGVHLNDAGHAILTQRVIDADILSSIYLSPTEVDYGIKQILINPYSECGDSNAIVKVVVANYGLVDSVNAMLFASAENITTNQIYLDSLIFSPIQACEIDTFTFNFNTYNAGSYIIHSYCQATHDSISQNDTLIKSLQSIGHPEGHPLFDTLCLPGTGQLMASAESLDTVLWYNSPNDSIPFYGGPNFQSSFMDSTNSWYYEIIRGELFYSSHLATTTNSNINWNGAMLNLVPHQDLYLDSIGIKINTLGLQNIDIYFKLGTYVGSENTPGDWILMTTISKVITDNVNLTYFPLSAFHLAGIDTLGLYFQMSDPQSKLSYRTVSSSITRSSPELTIITGTGISHNFVGSYFPRDLNCDIKYHFGERPLGACSTGKFPATIFVSDFELNIGNDTIIDVDDSLVIIAPNNLNNWTWSTNSTDSMITVFGHILGAGIHYIVLDGYDSLGCFKTDELIIGVADLVGLNPENKSKFIAVFPNPTDNYVLSNLNNIKAIDVFDFSGNRVMTCQEFPVNLTEMLAGQYLFKIVDNDGNTYALQVIKK